MINLINSFFAGTLGKFTNLYAEYETGAKLLQTVFLVKRKDEGNMSF